jgi:L-rhamnose mutarotase
MTRHVLTVDLRDDPAAIAAYREYHREVWPEVIESLRRSGVEGMEIHLLGRRLVMILELQDGADYRSVFADHVASSPLVGQWEQLMRSLQEPVPGTPSGDSWALMEPVFRLNPHRAVVR